MFGRRFDSAHLHYSFSTLILAVFGLMAGAVNLVVELGVRHIGAAGALFHEFHEILEPGRIDVARH